MSNNLSRAAVTLVEKFRALIELLPKVRRCVLRIALVALVLFIPTIIMPWEIKAPFLGLYALTLGLFGIPLVFGALIDDLKEVLRGSPDGRGRSVRGRT